MKTVGFLLFLVPLIAACTPAQPVAEDLEVAFSCVDGTAVTVLFSPANSTAVLMRHGDSIELRQQPSGSGFIYSNGPTTIRGKGDELTVEIGRIVPIQCQAVSAAEER